MVWRLLPIPKLRYSVFLWLITQVMAAPVLAQHPANGYQVAKRTHGVTLDGVVTNSLEWSEAELRGGKWYESGGPFADQPSSFTSQFRLLWDPDPLLGGLYVWGQTNHRAPLVTTGGSAVSDGSYDAVSLFFDPNLDLENAEVRPANAPDSYQFTFNVTGPASSTLNASQKYLVGGQVDTGNLPISISAHVNSLTGNQGGMTYSGYPPDLTDSGFSLATLGTPSGWSFEMFTPWTMFDACTGGPNGNGDGLCLTLDTLLGAPSTGEQWYFNLGSVFQEGGQLHYPAFATFPGDNSLTSFAAWPHPTIEFVDTYIPPPGDPSDLNGDGAVDASDAGILFENWGKSGASGDINQDTLIDAADAGILFESWTGDSIALPEPAGVGAMVWLSMWMVCTNRVRRR